MVLLQSNVIYHTELSSCLVNDANQAGAPVGNTKASVDDFSVSLCTQRVVYVSIMPHSKNLLTRANCNTTLVMPWPDPGIT